MFLLKYKDKFFLLLFLIFIFFFISSGNILCQELNVDINVGFAGNYIPDNWIPFTIVITNSGELVSGDIIINITKEDLLSDKISSKNHTISVELPAQSRKIFRETIYYKDDFFSDLTIYVTSNGQVLYQEELELKRIYENQKILLVSDSYSEFDFLTGINANNVSILYQDPEFLPDKWTAYQGIDLIILDSVAYLALNSRQKEALIGYLELGNNILISNKGNYYTYSNEFISNILPLEFIKKETINIENGPVSKEFLQLGFLDFITEDMINSVSFYFPQRYQIFLLLLSFILVLIYFLYKYLCRKKLNLSLFLIIYFFFIILYSGIIYISIYQPIIEKNNIMSEISIINLIPDSDLSLVEGYISYQDFKRKEIGFEIEKSRGDFIVSSDLEIFDKLPELHLKDELIELKLNRDGKKIANVFRSYYKAQLSLYFKIQELDNSLMLNLTNNSQFLIDSLFIKVNGKWYVVKGPISGKQEEYQLELKTIENRRPWYYWYVDNNNTENLPDNVGVKLMNNILERIGNEIENMKHEEKSDNIEIIGILVDGDFAVISTEASVNRKFMGIFKTSCPGQGIVIKED